ncbi:MAG: type II secretion system F family protein [Halorientalis sp.]
MAEENPPVDDAGESDEDDLDEDEFWGKYGRRPAAEPEGAAFETEDDERKRADQLLQGVDLTPSGLENISRAELRQYYGPLRTLFKTREHRYRSFQRKLTQARLATTYDQYLAGVVGRMVALLVAGVLLGVVVAGIVLGGARYGYLAGVLDRLGLRPGAVAGALLGVSVLAGVVGAAAYWSWHRVLKLRIRIGRRRRDIEYNLPYAVTFMYALSRADLPFDRIVERLAAAGDTYGAVAAEFDRVVRDDEMFGNSLYTGLENLRAVTPSEELRRIVGDLEVLLKTGGDIEAFLRDEIDAQLQTAVDAQEAYIEKLELLSEVFVVGLVAVPLFVVIVLLVIAFVGTATLTAMALFVYVVLPLALAVFFAAVDVVGTPFGEQPVSSRSGSEGTAPPPDSDAPEWRQAYEREKRLSGIRARLRDQFVRVSERPWRALLFSVPIAIALPVLGVQTGAVDASVGALVADPVLLTSQLVVAPLVVAAAPVGAVYEYRRRQHRATRERFPALLKLLATSNRRGLSLTRGLDIVSESTSGRLADQVRLLRNDITWNADLLAAFEAFGDRLSSPTLTRTARLLAEGSRVTSDIHVVLDVAATDIAERTRLRRERRETLSTYLVIVVVGFLVYLLVVLIMTSSFLEPIEALNAATAGAEREEAPISIASIPVPELQVVLFHSALVQGIGTGLVAGKLTENSLYGGVKYGLGLAVLTVVVFALA